MASDRPDIIKRPDTKRPDIKRSEGPARADGPLLSALREEAGLPREVYTLLAQANLLRMRGRWEDAVGQCMAALRLVPDSISAQSLLGDIYENQGRCDDAIQWYRMALDTNPDSPADRLKLDRLLQRQTPTARADRKTVAPKTVPLDPDAEYAALSASPAPLWRRLTQDPETALRVGALAAALLVCLVVVFAYTTVHRRAALASLGFGTYQEVKAAPIEVTPTPDPPATSGSDVTPRDSAEQAVLSTLRGSSDLSTLGVTVGDVQFDPRAGRMTITVSLPAAGGLTQAAVLRDALHVARQGAAVSPSTTAFTLRGLTTPASGGGAALIFVGDVAQSALPGAGAAEPDESHLPALFTDPWWSPQIPL